MKISLGVPGGLDFITGSVSKRICLASIALFIFSSVSFGQTVIAWGDDSAGQTNVPESATNIAAVAAGRSHSIALRSDGTLLTWGSITNVHPSATNIISVASGAQYCLALRNDGRVFAWGGNTSATNNIPYSDIKAIAAGNNHNLALRSNGTVHAWGYNYNGQTTVPSNLSNVVAISAGAEHSMALLADGSVRTWGALNESRYIGGLSSPRKNVRTSWESMLA